MTKSASRHRRQGKIAAALPIAYAFNPAVVSNIQLRARLALDAFRQSDSSLDDRAAIDTLLVIGLVLAGDHTPDVGSCIEKARRILIDVGSSIQQAQEGTPTNEQFVQLSEGLSYCEALFETSTRRKVRDAVLEALRSTDF